MRSAGQAGPGASPGDPPGQSPTGAGGETRRFQVFDGDGQFVGMFASWDVAHAWGHRRAAEPLTRLPIRIEDQLDRRTWTVGPGQCRLTVWRRPAEREPAASWAAAAFSASSATTPRAPRAAQTAAGPPGGQQVRRAGN
ncbi:hypothetical protein [Frankia sp. EI5c]|uniref:hypothetical protein n=1 Tax=Frankia sp. EI5c TaxID=683316 RepID=UPI000FF8A4A3|nr:hypothetical protein [Frankia sp. EI5c]